MLPYQILASTIHGKYNKNYLKTTNFKYQLKHKMINLNYLMDYIIHQIFKIMLSILSKKHETLTNQTPIRIYVNKIENRIAFKTKSGYYYELLTGETTKILGCTKNK